MKHNLNLGKTQPALTPACRQAGQTGYQLASIKKRGKILWCYAVELYY